jgi:hypothetical protein
LPGTITDKENQIMGALTAGVASLSAVTDTTASLSATAATGGTGPYTYQWGRSLTNSAFVAITGATSLTLNDTGLIPNTTYYYQLIATDSAAASVDYTAVQVLTQPQALSQNQFQQAAYVGAPDLRFALGTISAQISPNQATPLYNGMAVKVDTTIVQNGANRIPQVVGCTTDSDLVAGFIIYDIKSLAYNAGDRIEMCTQEGVLYLFSTGAITPFTQVTLDLTTGGGVAQSSAHSGNNIVGWAIDGASAAGQLIRVHVQTPTFLFA